MLQVIPERIVNMALLTKLIGQNQWKVKRELKHFATSEITDLIVLGMDMEIKECKQIHSLNSIIIIDFTK